MELFYVGPDDRMMAVSLRAPSGNQPIEVGVPVSLFPVQMRINEVSAYQYEVSRDGQRFLVNAGTDAGPSVIRVIVNWAPPQ